jgi:hypothetical protein
VEPVREGDEERGGVEERDGEQDAEREALSRDGDDGGPAAGGGAQGGGGFKQGVLEHGGTSWCGMRRIQARNAVMGFRHRTAVGCSCLSRKMCGHGHHRFSGGRF